MLRADDNISAIGGRSRLDHSNTIGGLEHFLVEK